MGLQELRFRATHLDAVRAGTKRITMRYNDPVEVGPVTLVFEFDEEVRLPGRIVSTVAKRVDAVTEEEALEDGFAGAHDVIAGLSSYYPDLKPNDELVIVRFELGLRFRPGDDDTWIVLLDADGNRQLAIQQVAELKRSTWPSPEVPMQAHLDYAVPSVAELERHRKRAEDLGARVLHDRAADAGEPLYVLADPAGHPFCLLVADL